MHCAGNVLSTSTDELDENGNPVDVAVSLSTAVDQQACSTFIASSDSLGL